MENHTFWGAWKPNIEGSNSRSYLLPQTKKPRPFNLGFFSYPYPLSSKITWKGE